MAARGSFQKRQKEFARKEKRQLKLERRQGRKTGEPETGGSTEVEDEEPEEDLEEIEIGPNGELVIKPIVKSAKSQTDSL